MSERIVERTKTVDETALDLGVSRRTVERYISRGKLAAFKTLSGRVAVTEASIAVAKRPIPITPADSAPEAESSAERAS